MWYEVRGGKAKRYSLVETRLKGVLRYSAVWKEGNFEMLGIVSTYQTTAPEILKEPEHLILLHSLKTLLISKIEMRTALRWLIVSVSCETNPGSRKQNANVLLMC